MRKIILLLLPVLALVGGAFAGDMLRAPSAPNTAPPAETREADAAKDDAGHGEAAPQGHGEEGHAEAAEAAWFTFPSQFFVPLMRQGDLRDMMILTLTLQTDGENVEALGRKEHALRDALLRQLMIHANTGGFDGNFTADRTLQGLREDLLKAAQAVTDLPLSAVLIEDIARQAG